MMATVETVNKTTESVKVKTHDPIFRDIDHNLTLKIQFQIIVTNPFHHDILLYPFCNRFVAYHR